MVRYLSPEWLAELGAFVAEDETLRRAARQAPITVAVRVTGAPGGDVAYQIRAQEGRVSIVPEAGSCDVQLTTDYPTARAIATGTINAQSAFVSGRLILAGELDRLVESQPFFVAFDDASAPLHERTEFD